MFLHRIGNPILYLSRLGRTILRRKVTKLQHRWRTTFTAAKVDSCILQATGAHLIALSQHADRILKRLVLALVIVFRTEIIDLRLRLV